MYTCIYIYIYVYMYITSPNKRMIPKFKMKPKATRSSWLLFQTNLKPMK